MIEPDAPVTPVRPGHYRQKVPGIECIDVVQWFGFNTGNVIKYVWRADDKGMALEDLQKAKQYLEFEIEKRTREAGP